MPAPQAVFDLIERFERNSEALQPGGAARGADARPA